MDLRQLREALEHANIDASAEILLVTRDSKARKIMRHSCLRVRSHIPSGTAPLRYRVIVCVRPFDVGEVDKLQKWLRDTRRPTKVWRLAELVREVIETINAHLDPSFYKERADIEATTTTALTKGADDSCSGDDLGRVLSTNGVEDFDPQNPSWLVQMGRLRRFALQYGRIDCEDLWEECRRLTTLAKALGLKATKNGFHSAIKAIRERRAGIRKSTRVLSGDLQVLVLRHIHKNRTSDHREGARLHRFFQDELGQECKLSAVRTCIIDLVRQGLLPRRRSAPARMTIERWIRENIDVSRAHNSDEARRLHWLARSEGKPWRYGSIMSRLGIMTTSGELPPPRNAVGWAWKLVRKLTKRTKKLERENKWLRKRLEGH